MRVRLAALVPALLALTLAGAGCGGGDDEAGAPTPTPVVPASTPEGGAPQTGATGSGAEGTTPAGGGVSTKDSISVLISKNPDLRTLSIAINAAGLAPALDSGKYTVFAPNNDAFTKLGTQLDTLLQPGAKAQLGNILKFHVVKGKFKSKKLTDGKLLTTLQGTRVRVTVKDGQVSLGNSLGKAVVLTPDAKASNGVVHTIDSVLKPKNG